MKKFLRRGLLLVGILTVLLTGCTAADGDGTATGASSTTTTATAIRGKTTTAGTNVKEINVLDYGVDNTGKTDETVTLTRLHDTGNKIYYPNGTYLFNGKTLNFSGGVRFESYDGVVIRNSISDTPIVNFDNKGNLIGLMHNHLEYRFMDDEIGTIGNLVSPPISDANYETKVDLLATWYNDFGIYCRLSGGGWAGWYSWEWNHHDCDTIDGITDPYDPDLHPLLGWYRGDNAKVLDWQCYWLREYGINHAALTQAEISTDRNSGGFWVYQLLNKAPNSKNMDFALWMPNHGYDETIQMYRYGWGNAFEQFYFNEQYKEQVYCYEEDGKRYGVIWLWDEKAIRYSLDADNQEFMPNTVEWYKEVARAFRENGYDGVCILARFGCIPEFQMANLDKAGVKWFAISYPENSLGSGYTYGERISNFKTLSDSRTLYGVATGVNTHDPHPSQWVCPGGTPALFNEWLDKAVEATLADKDRAKIVTCYNVSEWAEGGPGLVPTVGQGFGYLEAIYDAIVVK